MQHRSRAFRPLLLSLIPASLLSAAAAAASVSVPAAPSPAGNAKAERSGLPNFDTFLSEISTRRIATPAGLTGRTQKTIFDAQLGKPTVLWAKPGETPIAVGPLATEQALLVATARSYLREQASLLGLSDDMIDGADVSFASYNGSGGAVVRLRQRVNGHEVFHRYLNVVLDRSNRPIAVTGYFADPGNASTSYSFSAAQAIASAWTSIGGTLSAATLVPATTVGEYQWFNTPLLAATSSHVFERGPRVRKIYYPRNGSLEPAFYVELLARAKAGQSVSGYAFVVSAKSGAVLHRDNLTSDATAFTYRVHADAAAPYAPYDSPLGNGYAPSPTLDIAGKVPRVGVASQLVTVSGLNKFSDPWLADDATTTVGNHVDSCIDVVDTPLSGIISTQPLNTCTPLLGDVRGTTTSAHTFDYEVAADSDPSTTNARKGAAVSMFYLTNWLHDLWYDHGFDEASGNAQTDNYGRGGAEGDPLLAQGQDASGRNNANMSTPADGSSPVMQQYLFDGPIVGQVNQTAPTAGPALTFSVASFGPSSYDISGDAALISDQVGDSMTDGCGLTDPLLGLVTLPGVPDPTLLGKIVLIDRGNCNFTTKALYGQLSGAAAVVVVNNTDGEPITMGNGDLPIDVGASPTDALYQIPTIMVRKADGDALKAQLANGENVSMHIVREESTDLDGTMDNQIIAHEYFHYVHHRLTDSSNQQSGAMSEGWGDTDAMLLSVRADDVNVAGNDHWQGAYGLAGYVINNFYLGIRRAPYSTDLEKNGFTLKYISDGEPTPDGGDGSSNSEVHNAGEIWANMMWECYAGLLNHYPFAVAQDHMRDIIIGGFKATPADATYTEARDAVLTAAKAISNDDYILCGNGFAHRGAGPAAVAPARDSSDLTGVTEDYTPYGTVSGGTTGGETTGGETTGGSTTGSTTGGDPAMTPPTAGLSATPTTGEAPLQVTFDASSSASADGSALSYTFLFGDGTDPVTTSTPVISYTYPAAGSFDAQVVVTDGNGNTASSDKVTIKTTITVVVGGSDHAVAAMIVSPTSGPAPLHVDFDGSRSFGADNHAITQYTWDFGDGSPVMTTAAATTSHVYTKVGTFTPSLSVTDEAGNVSPEKAMAQVKTAGGGTGGTTGGSTGGASGGSSSANGNNGGALGFGLLAALSAFGLLRRRRLLSRR